MAKQRTDRFVVGFEYKNSVIYGQEKQQIDCEDHKFRWLRPLSLMSAYKVRKNFSDSIIFELVPYKPKKRKRK